MLNIPKLVHRYFAAITQPASQFGLEQENISFGKCNTLSTYQRFKLFGIDQIKLFDEEIEMFVASVAVSLGTDG